MITIKFIIEYQGQTLEQTQDFEEPFEEIQLRVWIQGNFPQAELVSYEQL
jgi:hypothetical protein